MSTETLTTEEGLKSVESSANTTSNSINIDLDEIPPKELPPPYPESDEKKDVDSTESDEKKDVDSTESDEKKDVDSTEESSETTVVEPDPWDILDEQDNTVSWKDLTWPWKIWRVIWIIARICIVVGLLYLFICSLDVLSDSFQLLAGRAAGSLFSNSVLINNPVSALMIGVLVTVLVQSSSTSTSIVVSMVGSGLITVQQGIPIIMGANIGTTVTNTLVSLSQSIDRDAFRRSFAGATVHDAFNWLTVLVLLPLECASHYLYHLTEAMTQNIVPPEDSENPQFLKAITEPLTKLIIEIDSKVITAIAEESDRQKFPIAQYYCTEVIQSYSKNMSTDLAEELYAQLNNEMFSYDVYKEDYNNTNTSYISYKQVDEANSTKCTHMCTGVGLPGAVSEPLAGGLMLLGTVIVMTLCLLLMVKVLNSLIRGPMAKLLRKVVNADFPGCFSYFTGYVAMLVGCGITIIFQSSSVFTSTLTPLVGMGVITVERMYPLTLGSNIGTTVTSIMAALAGDPSKINDTLQMSFCHLFFNISGIILYYPIPFMRIPVPIAKRLGTITAQYRWFAIVYLIGMFLLFPLIVFGLSLAGWYVLVAVGVPFLILMAFVIVVNVLQNKKPNWLPKFLRTWDFLPLACRSLEPYDKAITVCCRSEKCCCNKKKGSDSHSQSDIEAGTETDEDKSEHMEASEKTETLAETTNVSNDGTVNSGFEGDAYEELSEDF